MSDTTAAAGGAARDPHGAILHTTETSPEGTSCGLCGRTPARGYAQVNDTWLCHRQHEDEPDCFSRWGRDLAW